MIYQGKTAACLPIYSFPADWNVIYTQNHWSNEEKTQEYITKVILPYIQVIYDRFKGQLTDAVHSLLDSNYV